MSRVKRQAALGFVFVTALLDVLSFGIIIPVLPELLKEFVGGSTSKAAYYAGMFGTVWALMQFIFSPLMGSLSDRFGRRPVLLLSCLGMGLDYILMAKAPDLTWLFIGRMISGITAASFSTAGAYIADVLPPEKRASGYGILGAAFGLGFVMGPALGGVLGSIDLRLPFWIAAGLSLLNFTYGFIILPESLPRDRRKAFSFARANPIGSLHFLRSKPQLLELAGLGFLYQLSHQVLQQVFVLYTGHRYHWEERTVGFSLALVGVCSIIVQASLVRPLVAKFGERIMILVAITSGIAGFTIFGLAPNSAWIWFGIPVLAGMGFFMPSMNALMSRKVDAQSQGQLQGANSSVMGISGIIGPTLFGSIFSFVTQKNWGSPAIGAPYFTAALLLLIAFALAWQIVSPHDNRSLQLGRDDKDMI